MNPQLHGFIAWWEGESQGTIRMIEAIPQDKLNVKIHEKVRSLGELAHHLAEAITNVITFVEKGQVDYRGSADVPQTVTELASNYKKAIEDGLNRARKLTDAQINAHIPFEMNGEVVWNPTGLEMIGMFVAHEVHHRGQMSAILRQVGGKVPGMYGPTADDMMG